MIYNRFTILMILYSTLACVQRKERIIYTIIIIIVIENLIHASVLIYFILMKAKFKLFFVTIQRPKSSTIFWG